MGDGEEGKDRVQLATDVTGVVDTIDTHAHLEAQGRLIAQHPRKGEEVLPMDEEGDLTTIDDNFVDRGGHGQSTIGKSQLDLFGGRIEPAAVGALGCQRHDDRGDETAESGCIATVLGRECAVAHADDLKFTHTLREGGHGDCDLEAGLLGSDRCLGAHRSRPRNSKVGTAVSAASSCACSSRTALAPNFMFWISAWIFKIASMSISGRGGHPGRYMSTGTT